MFFVQLLTSVFVVAGLVVVMVEWRPGVVEVAKKVLGHTRGHYSAADIATAPGEAFITVRGVMSHYYARLLYMCYQTQGIWTNKIC